MRPRLLLLGGIDPSGGAGLTLDAVVAARFGVHALPVVTAGTAQNRHRFVARYPIPAPQLAATLTAALEDGPVAAVKIGMLGDTATVAFVAAAMRRLPATTPIVVDPVLVSTADGPDACPELAAAYREHLLPVASLLLPNHLEIAALGGDQPDAWRRFGCRAVLQKDGHGDGASAADVLWQRDGAARPFRRPRLPVGRVRGTGCALATAIAARLADGSPLEAACGEAGDWLHERLRELGPAPPDGLPRLLPLVSRTST